MFKKFVLAAAARSMVAAPIAQAQAAPTNQNYGWSQQHKKPTVHKKKAPVRKWSRGHKAPNWKKQHHIRDYDRYGLHRLAKGQEWIKVGNDYLLIGIATGIIASIVASH